MPYNQNGTADPNLLSIPRACVDIALLGSDDKPAYGWRHVGDVSQAAVQFAFEEAEHFTSCGEQRVRNARVAVQVTADLEMTFDALLDTRNIELLMSGSSDSRLTNEFASLTNLASQYTIDIQAQYMRGSGILLVPNPYYTGIDKHDDIAPWGRQYQIWGEGYRVYAGAASGHTFRTESTALALGASTTAPFPSNAVPGDLFAVTNSVTTVLGTTNQLSVTNGQFLVCIRGSVADAGPPAIHEGSTTDGLDWEVRETVTGNRFTVPSWFPDYDIRRLNNVDQVKLYQILHTGGAPTSLQLDDAIIDPTKPLDGFDVDITNGSIRWDFNTGGATGVHQAIAAQGNTTEGRLKKFLKLVIELENSETHATQPHIDRIRALTRTSRPVAIRFRQQDTNRAGFRAVATIHKARLIPNGAFNFVSDGTEFSNQTMSASLELPSWADANTPGREGWLTIEHVTS